MSLTKTLKNLSGDTLNYGVGQVLPQVIGFFLIPLYTAYLTPADYGIVELCSLLAAALALTMRAGVPGAVTRFYYDYDEGPELRDYVTTVSRFLLVAGVVVAALVIAASPLAVPVLLPDLPVWPFVPLVAGTAMFAASNDLQRRLLQARRQSAYTAKLNVAFAAISISLTLLLVVGFEAGALGMVMAQFMTVLVFFAHARRYLTPDLTGSFQRGALRQSLRYGMGVLPAHLLNRATPLITRGLLLHMGSVAAVGHIALASRFVAPLQIFAYAFQSAYMPIYFHARKRGSVQDRVSLVQTSSVVWITTVWAIGAAALLGPPAIEIMTPERYHAAKPLVPVLAIGFAGQVVYTLFGAEIFYSKRTRLLPLVTLAGAGVNVVVTIALTPTLGPLGVAWGATAGLLVTGFIAMLVTRRTRESGYDWVSMIRASLVGLALFCAGLWAGTDTWSQVAIGGLFVVAYPATLAVSGERHIRAGMRKLLSRGSSPDRPTV